MLAILAWVGLSVGLLLGSRHDGAIVAGSAVAALLVLCLFPAQRALFTIVMVGGVCTLVLLEVGLRLSLFGPVALSQPMDYGPYAGVRNRGMIRYIGEPLIYSLDPRFEGNFMGQRLRVNPEGFRGPALERARKPGVTRVIAIGSSLTMGGGVPEWDTYPAQLDRLLGDGVEVFNFALPAYPMALRFRLVEYAIAEFQPDVIVLEVSDGAIYDDGDYRDILRVFGPNPVPEPPISRVERYSFAATALYPPTNFRATLESLSGRLLDRWPGTLSAQAAPETTALPSTAYFAREVARLSGHKKTELVLFLVRPMNQFENGKLHFDTRQTVRAVGAQNDSLVVDSYPLFRPGEFADDFIVFPGDNHPNGRALARFAEALAQAIAPLLPRRPE